MQGKLNTKVASIQVRRGNESLGVHRMADETSLIIGSDESCGLSLENPAIAAKHCVLRMADGELFINDWYSETGTLINGEKIYVETKLDLRDRVSVGDFELRFAVTSAMNVDEASFDDVFAASIEETVAAVSDEIEESVDAVEAIAAPVAATPTEVLDDVSRLVESIRQEREQDIEPSDWDQEEVPRLEAPQSQSTEQQNDSTHALETKLADARSEIESLKSELEYQLNLNSIATLDDSPKAEEFDPMDVDVSDLMRAEIEHLQRELEMREEEIQQLIGDGASANVNEAAVLDTDTEKLVGRLEQLLEELDESDRRAKSLETMLQAADEATEAEREERRQIETWVSEVEERVITRQQQWQAAEEKLVQRLNDSDQLCRRLSANMKVESRGQNEERDREYQAIVTDLTETNKAIGDQLEATTVELEQLKQLVEDSNVSEGDLANMREQMDAMRRHEVEMSQERALMARQKSELVRLREELEASQHAVESATDDNPDLKVRAFREHLKQIHEEEKNQQQERRGLASRIASLWNRLEDR